MRREVNVLKWNATISNLLKDLAKMQILVTEEQVWKAIQIYCAGKFPDEVEFWTDIIHLDIDYPLLLDYLAENDFELNDIEFDTSTADLHYTLILMIKAEVKHKGIKWIVHKYDIDPFPSSPHAHDIDNNLKMHLGNGNLYKKRKLVGKLSKNEFNEVRQKLEIKGIILPSLDI